MDTGKRLEDYTREELVEKVEELEVYKLAVLGVEQKLNKMAECTEEYAKKDVVFSMCGFIRNFIIDLFNKEMAELKQGGNKDGK